MIKALLLDLDNTLYPASSAMDAGFSRRIVRFISDFLHISGEEAAALRNANLPHFGTTLEWLKKAEGLTDDEAFFRAVHPDSETGEVEKDPALRGFLLSLGLPLFLLTNAPYVHAERMLRHLDVLDIFSGIYDLTWNQGRGKPYPSAFLNPLADAGFSPQETLFADDSPKYVLGYRAVGGVPILVDESGRHAGFAAREGIVSVPSVYALPDTGLLPVAGAGGD